MWFFNSVIGSLPVQPKHEEKFWTKVDKTNNCWNWTGTKTWAGYGRFYLKGKLVLAHRFAYEQTKGAIPDGLMLDHLCRNPTCVNPNHLEPVTCKENLLRGETVNALHAAKTHCIHGHPLVEGNLVKDKLPERWCLICQRKFARTSYERHKNHKCKECRRNLTTCCCPKTMLSDGVR